MLEINQPDRQLYLAVPIDAYETFFQTRFTQLVLQRYSLKLIVYDPLLEEVVQWCK
jgi:hypothetical protein